jgi:Ca2+-binding EF-hand superfamily protein
MGVRMTEEHVREMVKEVDTSNRGRISFSQFQQLFRNVNGR